MRLKFLMLESVLFAFLISGCGNIQASSKNITTSEASNGNSTVSASSIPTLDITKLNDPYIRLTNSSSYDNAGSYSGLTKNVFLNRYDAGSDTSGGFCTEMISLHRTADQGVPNSYTVDTADLVSGTVDGNGNISWVNTKRLHLQNDGSVLVQSFDSVANKGANFTPYLLLPSNLHQGETWSYQGVGDSTVKCMVMGIGTVTVLSQGMNPIPDCLIVNQLTTYPNSPKDDSLDAIAYMLGTGMVQEEITTPGQSPSSMYSYVGSYGAVPPSLFSGYQQSTNG